MPFAFELTFTGLCILTMKGADKRRPQEANVLLVKTPEGRGAHNGHQHLPRLNFATENMVLPDSPLGHQLVPLPSGLTMATRDISGLSLSIRAPGGTPAQIEARWLPDPPAGTPRPQAPTNPPPNAEEEYLDWVPNLRAINPEVQTATDEAPHAGLDPNEVAARVRLGHGILKAALVGTSANAQRFLVWDFKDSPTGAFTEAASQAIAGLIVLRIEGLQTVAITGLPQGREVLLRPPRREPGATVVRASVTNLPEDDLGESNVLRHFEQFFAATTFSARPATLRVPHARQGGLDSSTSGICPPARHTGP